ncbi:MAG: TetR/AcrR family transcriptional regulator, partial [Burkholderiaceae bacterium]|nr:TetR/AcrR family transcriptional regulator [Burkholderiaceae bacterium]
MAIDEESKPRVSDRQRAIADAARALIAERGFEGLRTRDIAERVGINIATLHYHVPTKQALIQLVAQSLRDDFVSQHARMPRAGLSPLQRLAAELSDYRDTLQNNIELFQVMAELSARARRDAEVEAELAPMRRYWHAQ